eukprot:1158398-Pelagomonas_calceolata.AAC.10
MVPSTSGTQRMFIVQVVRVREPLWATGKRSESSGNDKCSDLYEDAARPGRRDCFAYPAAVPGDC